jgi:hypothetical protein
MQFILHGNTVYKNHGGKMHIDENPLSFPPPSTLHSQGEPISDCNNRRERVVLMREKAWTTGLPDHAFLA